MAAHPVESSFRFPDLIAAPSHPDAKFEMESQHCPPDRALGAFRGLAFALFFEAAFGIIVFSGWQFWHLLR
jgi:hypothetical protein